jgi:hypothetical protein
MWTVVQSVLVIKRLVDCVMFMLVNVHVHAVLQAY